MAPRARKPRAPRPAASRRARWTSRVALVVGGACVAALAYVLIVYPARGAGGAGREVSITLARGETLAGALAQLERAGVVPSPFVFGVYARLLGADERLREGEVLLRDDMTPREVLQRIAIGFGSAAVSVVVPEGFHRFAIAARLDRWGVCDEAAFLAASTDRALLDELGVPGPSAEGYLFPDTYRLREGMAAADVVRRMVENHARRTERVFADGAAGLARLASDLGWTRHEVIVLASIVEKEAVVAEERPIIAGVFLNRLRDPTFVPHRLDADPTVTYGCLDAPSEAPSCASYRGRISRAMTHDPANRYNTYRREGLPPGPIASPGLDSLRAVLAPSDHRHLFFVATGHGRHTFSDTIEEHNRAVARARER